MSILIFSDLYLPTFPYLEIPLYNELKSRGIDVQYVLQDGDIRLTDPELYKTFSKLNLRTIKKPKHITQLFSKVFSLCYKYTKLPLLLKPDFTGFEGYPVNLVIVCVC